MPCRKQHAKIGLDANNNDFHVENKEESGAPKKFENEGLEALLHEASCQTLVELAESLEVDTN